MRIYTHKKIEVTNRMTKVFQYLEHQTQYHFERIGEVMNAERRDEYVVRLCWQGLDDEEYVGAGVEGTDGSTGGVG